LQEYNKRTTHYLSQDQDDLPEYSSPPPPAKATDPISANKDLGNEGNHPPKKAKKGKSWKLEEIERWTMVKRIW